VAAPMLDAIAIKGRTITADALLTQRKLANYLVGRGANYHFTVKGNQGKLLDDLTTYFQSVPKPADFTHTGGGEHGRIEKRTI
jgi:predicted transposase YbfD/YdcC